MDSLSQISHVPLEELWRVAVLPRKVLFPDDQIRTNPGKPPKNGKSPVYITIFQICFTNPSLYTWYLFQSLIKNPPGRAGTHNSRQTVRYLPCR